MAYLALFLVAFLSATVLPLQSEAVLAALLIDNAQPWLWLLSVAALGNTLGAGVNWALGKAASRFEGRPWYPASPHRLARARSLYARYGRWLLLCSWVPVIGDALTVVAGGMGEPFWRFLLLVGLGKTARYLALAASVAGWFPAS